MPSRHPYHEYRLIRRTQKRVDDAIEWVERCNCGAIVVCEAQFTVSARSALIRKTWFDKDGVMVKVTGSHERPTERFTVNRKLSPIEAVQSHEGNGALRGQQAAAAARPADSILRSEQRTNTGDLPAPPANNEPEKEVNR